MVMARVIPICFTMPPQVKEALLESDAPTFSIMLSQNQQSPDPLITFA